VNGRMFSKAMDKFYAFRWLGGDDAEWATFSTPVGVPADWAIIVACDIDEAKQKLVRGQLLRPAFGSAQDMVS
jgi:hypothetical protein